MSMIVAGFHALVFAQISSSSLLPFATAWSGKFVTHGVHGAAEIVIKSGRIVYAKWDRVAGCNLDPKRSDCLHVEQSVRLLHPCVLLWKVPFEDNSIDASDSRIVLRHEFCELDVNE